jgi:cytidylate kinase
MGQETGSSPTMAVVTVSGEPGCRTREVAQLAAQRLGFEHISASRLSSMLEEEFGPADGLPDKAWPSAVASILVRHATGANLVVGMDGAELLFRDFSSLLRIRIIAPQNRRIGNTMLDDHLDRPGARQRLREQETELKAIRRRRFGRATPAPHAFDLMLNAETISTEQMAILIESAVRTRGLVEQGFLSQAAEALLQFQYRYALSREGIQPRTQTPLKRAIFSHPSEQIFANLLDFYRIPWEYEPRSFPVQWDKDGHVLEAFTPDFFLPESDMYVELTTMKQSLVTKKNRKVKLLRAIYPDVNIQVFYQKDLQDLVLKYGLVEDHTGKA